MDSTTRENIKVEIEHLKNTIDQLSFIKPIFAWNAPLVSLIFLKRSLVLPILLFPSISLLWLLRKAFLSLLLFFGTLHSDAYIFPFLLCFSLLFFLQLFGRPRQPAILLLFIFFFHGDGLDPCLLYSVTNLLMLTGAKDIKRWQEYTEELYKIKSSRPR